MRQSMAITNVHLVDGVTAPRRADVLMVDGRFVSFTHPGGPIPADAQLVDGTGKFLVPGLWEGHTHLMMGVHGSPDEQRAGVKAGLQTYLPRGITSVVDLGCPEELMNLVRSDIYADRAAFPSFYFAGPVFTGVNGWPLCMTCDHTSSWEVRPESPVESMVEGLQGKTDFIKIIYDGLPGGTEKFPSSALVRVIRTAHRLGKRVMVHIRSKDDVLEVVQAGADCIEHIFQPRTPDVLDEAEEAAEIMGKHKVFWCPTLSTYEQIGNLGSLDYL